MRVRSSAIADPHSGETPAFQRTPSRYNRSVATLITPVILSGGAGARLWPLSTPEHAKQFLTFAGDQTMLQATAARVADRARFAAPIVVANESQAGAIEAQLAEVGCTPAA